LKELIILKKSEMVLSEIYYSNTVLYY